MMQLIRWRASNFRLNMNKNWIVAVKACFQFFKKADFLALQLKHRKSKLFGILNLCNMVSTKEFGVTVLFSAS
jgi:hypothetical protein